MTRTISFRFYLFLLVSDQIAVVASLLLGTLARTMIHAGIPIAFGREQLPIPVYFTAMLAVLIAFVIVDVYNPQNTVSLVRELQSLTVASLAGWLALAGCLYFGYRDVSRLQMVYCFAVFLLIVFAHRTFIRLMFRLRDQRPFHVHPVLIVGGGATARRVKEQIEHHAWTGLRVIGFVGDEGESEASPRLGSLDQALDVIAEHKVEEVIFAIDPRQDPRARNLIAQLQDLPLNTRVVPDYFDLAFLLLRMEDLGGIPLLSLKEPVLRPPQRLIKRIFDILVVVILAIPTLIVLAVLAVAIRLDSPGPILFVQDRVGERQKIFRMYKFRSMVQDAEQRQDEVTTHDANGVLVHKRPDDPRVTRVGRFLRRTSLDELPQILNVLLGDMSLVGPRPEMIWMVDHYEPWQRKRFEVPQGMTGWWQINGRSERMMHEHIEDDLYYIRNYSLWLDIQILWRTVEVVLTGRGAY